MPGILKKGSEGAEVKQLQQLLNERGYQVATDGVFGTETYGAVRAFQAQNLDQHGQPLAVDGQVGALTWWSLTHDKHYVVTPTAVLFDELPPQEAGGGAVGRAALKAAIAELRQGAGETGGDNRGPYVRKYLQPAGVPEGEPWCASFVSWCYLQASGGRQNNMPFRYCPGARNLLEEFNAKGWASGPKSGYLPEPGDIVVWWRESQSGWKGHVGLVHQLKDGMLYTIEGNKSPKVQGFSYVFSRMERLLGFGHVP